MNIIRLGYYLPTLFNDSHRCVRKCEKCAFFLGKQRLDALPLLPIQIDQPFSQWGLEFIGPIKSPLVLLTNGSCSHRLLHKMDRSSSSEGFNRSFSGIIP